MEQLEQKALSVQGPAFVQKAKDVANSLNMDYASLLWIMNHESGFRTNLENPYIPCVGLIGFCPIWYNGKYTKEQILAMPAVQQMDLVDRYYRWYVDRYWDFSVPYNVFLSTFYPAAKGKPDNWILGSERDGNSTYGTPAQIDAYKRKIAEQNPGFDQDGDGYVSVLDYKKYLQKKLAPYGIDIGVSTNSSDIGNFFSGTLDEIQEAIPMDIDPEKKKYLVLGAIALFLAAGSILVYYFLIRKKR